MFIELVDALRCPVAHEESWLVASATRMAARHIAEGMLGCPVCHAQYPVRHGVVDFRREPRAISASAAAPDEDVAARLAALLDLTDGSGFAVLIGAWGIHAPLMHALTDTPLVLIDPPEGVEGQPGVSVLRCDGDLPLALGVARGVAIDEDSGSRVDSAVRVTRTAGRVVGPASLPLPAGVRELARDDRLWVGAREAPASPLVVLHVRRG